MSLRKVFGFDRVFTLLQDALETINTSAIIERHARTSRVLLGPAEESSRYSHVVRAVSACHQVYCTSSRMSIVLCTWLTFTTCIQSIYLTVKKKEVFPGRRAALSLQYRQSASLIQYTIQYPCRHIVWACAEADRGFISSRIQVFNVERPDWSKWYLIRGVYDVLFCISETWP
jgi:hypothetical protein